MSFGPAASPTNPDCGQPSQAIPAILDGVCDNEGHGPSLGLPQMAAPEHAVGEAAPGEPHLSFAEKHARDRSKAYEWLRTRPMDMIMICRLVIEPLTVLLTAKIDQGSEAWETRQQAKVAKAVLNGGSGEGVRQYRLKLVADMLVERKVHDGLDHLLATEAVYDAISPPSRTCRTRCLIFRLLSKLGCAMEWYLCRPARAFPSKVFTIIENPGAAAGLDGAMRECPDLLDPWVQELMELHGSSASPDFVAKVTAIGLEVHSCITGVETRHASLRRLVHSRVQTHKLVIPDLGVP